MKVKIYWETDYDDCIEQDMSINGEDVLHVGSLSECPEDAIIGRSLISCDEVVRFMKRAFEAGKNGEEFSVERIERKESK